MLLIKEDIYSTCKGKCHVIDVVNDFEEHQGMWTIIPAIFKISTHSKWYLLADDSSEINIRKVLSRILDAENISGDFFGFALQDKRPTIIHHFGFDLPDNFQYPLISAGVLISNTVIEKIKNSTDSLKLPSFAIDSSHEFAVSLFKNFNITLIDDPKFFCEKPNDHGSCGIWRKNKTEPLESVESNDIQVMIKTFHGNHKTRLPILLQTWFKKLPVAEICSDLEDPTIPTIDLKVGNTESGHCSKTWEIMRRFHGNTNGPSWLLIADDDTLIGWDRLRKMLGQYNPKDDLIIGERYGYGFSLDGNSGYDYPTGGAGMVFTRPAVEKILKECPKCFSSQDPDDMMIGMCAHMAKVKIIHENRFHQARVTDYAQELIRSPISFHKFEEIDAVETYYARLIEKSYSHAEL
ncbi:unnamed protein product [Caenorhabditis bovis]|uniref:N-acetylgalactosaminide beta-1,3-galactosyltransferase n=1 Tax=Caenorhabditis bovis TaxID=2654633 RepID=A0A8S1EIZ8_9PELO|nr:unnamed protein product [Caenorhabditis bovis]